MASDLIFWLLQASKNRLVKITAITLDIIN
jgi:hypothetical protein